MSESFSSFQRSNPFSARFTAPGKTPFFFERNFARYIKASKPEKFQAFFARALGAGQDVRFSVCLQYLVDQFESHSRRGQIVGGPGSGKTSLMLALKDALIQDGYEIFEWTLTERSRFLPDVFWYEVQKFLQATPVFLPSKCMLPPPVMSNEEFLAQQREAYRQYFAPDDERAKLDAMDAAAKSEAEEFRVSDERLAEMGNALPTSARTDPTADSAQNDEPTVRFGFDVDGNFRVNSFDAPDQRQTRADAPKLKFSPFSDYALEEVPTPPPCAESNDDAYDSIEIDVESEAQEREDNSSNEPELLFGAVDLQRNRTLFEKKALFFDGFEHLSYVNRIILRTFCRMNRLGLLIATNSPAIGVPVLFRTIPSAEILGELLRFLTEDFDGMEGMEIEESELEVLLKNFHYDVRKILFSLYDAYESYRRSPRNRRDEIVRRYPR